jgi:uncharacterized membrane protein
VCGSVIGLGVLLGNSYSYATSINDGGQVVGYSNGGSVISVINLGGLPVQQSLRHQ